MKFRFTLYLDFSWCIRNTRQSGSLRCWECCAWEFFHWSFHCVLQRHIWGRLTNVSPEPEDVPLEPNPVPAWPYSCSEPVLLISVAKNNNKVTAGLQLQIWLPATVSPLDTKCCTARVFIAHVFFEVWWDDMHTSVPADLTSLILTSESHGFWRVWLVLHASHSRHR